MDFEKNAKYTVSLGSDIAHILGFHEHIPYFLSFGTLKVRSLFQSSAHGNKGKMLIYCDIIEQSYMSDKFFNILCMLSREYSSTKNLIHVSFPNPVWHKIKNGQLI